MSTTWKPKWQKTSSANSGNSKLKRNQNRKTQNENGRELGRQQLEIEMGTTKRIDTDTRERKQNETTDVNNLKTEMTKDK